MAATYREVAYSVLEAYKKVHDDATVQLSQIVFYIQLITNRLRHENKDDKSLKKYLTRFCSIPVQVDKDCKDRKYIDLPTEIMDMENDRGVAYITYNHETGSCCTGSNFSQVQFQPTTPTESLRLAMDEYEKPSPQQPYFYRLTGVNGCDNVDRLEFLGLECVDVKDVEIGVMCSLSASSVCDLDSEIPLPDWLIEDLITRVTNLGRFILIAPQERTNEGSDLTTRSNNQVPATQAPPVTQDQQVSRLRDAAEQRDIIQQQLGQ